MFIGYFTERPYQDLESGYFGATGRAIQDLGLSNGSYNPRVGAELYNQALSERRARSVSTLLADYGIAEALIVWKGYGSRFPTAPNENEDGSDNPEGRAHNRRVEIIIEY